MPTRENCAQLDNLLEAASALVETKKQVDRIEQEIRVMQERLGRSSEGGDEEAMDVDENEGEGGEANEDGRAQSVVSTRSGRSSKPRKQVRHALYYRGQFAHECCLVVPKVDVSLFCRH